MSGIMNGKPIEPKIYMAVLYDPQTGRIAHCHRVVQFDSKKKVTEAHVDGRLREMATRHGWDVSKLKTLHVDPSKLERGMRYKVDLQKRTLLATPPQPMPHGDDPLRLKS